MSDSAENTTDNANPSLPENPPANNAAPVEVPAAPVVEAAAPPEAAPTVNEVPVTTPSSSAPQNTPEAPEEETPAEETPAEETPVEETPAEETPAEETPAEETPAEETPAEETPAEETPAEETPAEETPAEETTPAPVSQEQIDALETQLGIDLTQEVIDSYELTGADADAILNGEVPANILAQGPDAVVAFLHEDNSNPELPGSSTGPVEPLPDTTENSSETPTETPTETSTASDVADGYAPENYTPGTVTYTVVDGRILDSTGTDVTDTLDADVRQGILDGVTANDDNNPDTQETNTVTVVTADNGTVSINGEVIHQGQEDSGYNIALDADGNYVVTADEPVEGYQYVADYDSQTITILDANGKVVEVIEDAIIPPKDDLAPPAQVVLSGLNIDEGNTVYQNGQAVGTFDPATGTITFSDGRPPLDNVEKRETGEVVANNDGRLNVVVTADGHQVNVTTSYETDAQGNEVLVYRVDFNSWTEMQTGQAVGDVTTLVDLASTNEAGQEAKDAADLTNGLLAHMNNAEVGVPVMMGLSSTNDLIDQAEIDAMMASGGRLDEEEMQRLEAAGVHLIVGVKNPDGTVSFFSEKTQHDPASVYDSLRFIHNNPNASTDELNSANVALQTGTSVAIRPANDLNGTIALVANDQYGHIPDLISAGVIDASWVKDIGELLLQYEGLNEVTFKCLEASDTVEQQCEVQYELVQLQPNEQPVFVITYSVGEFSTTLQLKQGETPTPEQLEQVNKDLQAQVEAATTAQPEADVATGTRDQVHKDRFGGILAEGNTNGQDGTTGRSDNVLNIQEPIVDGAMMGVINPATGEPFYTMETLLDFQRDNPEGLKNLRLEVRGEINIAVGGNPEGSPMGDNRLNALLNNLHYDGANPPTSQMEMDAAVAFLQSQGAIIPSYDANGNIVPSLSGDIQLNLANEAVQLTMRSEAMLYAGYGAGVSVYTGPQPTLDQLMEAGLVVTNTLPDNGIEYVLLDAPGGNRVQGFSNEAYLMEYYEQGINDRILTPSQQVVADARATGQATAFYVDTWPSFFYDQNNQRMDSRIEQYRGHEFTDAHGTYWDGGIIISTGTQYTTQPMLDANGRPMLDPDGNPITEVIADPNAAQHVEQGAGIQNYITAQPDHKSLYWIETVGHPTIVDGVPFTEGANATIALQAQYGFTTGGQFAQTTQLYQVNNDLSATPEDHALPESLWTEQQRATVERGGQPPSLFSPDIYDHEQNQQVVTAAVTTGVAAPEVPAAEVTTLSTESGALIEEGLVAAHSGEPAVNTDEPDLSAIIANPELRNTVTAVVGQGFDGLVFDDQGNVLVRGDGVDSATVDGQVYGGTIMSVEELLTMDPADFTDAQWESVHALKNAVDTAAMQLGGLEVQNLDAARAIIGDLTADNVGQGQAQKDATFRDV
ncbi:hypothetical protein GC177_00005 [bacterium]|nr:hypothetical protein [bacterium]